MAKGDATVKAAQIRAAVERERLAQQKWEHSPEYLHQVLRERVHSEVQRQQFLEPAKERQQKRELELINKKAELDAQLLETRYTAKDKAGIAKLENQSRQAWQMLQSGEISQDDYEKFEKINQNRKLGIIPGQLPSLSPYPKGQGVGETWEQSGMLLSRKQNGETWQVDFAKTPQGIAQEHELKATQEKAKLDAKRQEKLTDAQESYKDYLVKKEVPDPESAIEGAKRKLTPDEIRADMDRRFPRIPMPAAEEVQHAKDFIAQMRDVWGNSPPPSALRGIQSAAEVIKASKERAW